LTRSSC